MVLAQQFSFFLLIVVLPLINKSILQKLKKAKSIQELPKSIKTFLKKNDFSQEKISQKFIKDKSRLLKGKKYFELFFKIMIILEILLIASHIILYKLTNNKPMLNGLEIDVVVTVVLLAIWIIIVIVSKSFINYNDILSQYLPRLLNGRSDSNVNSPNDKNKV
jgi:hypothetical protein